MLRAAAVLAAAMLWMPHLDAAPTRLVKVAAFPQKPYTLQTLGRTVLEVLARRA